MKACINWDVCMQHVTYIDTKIVQTDLFLAVKLHECFVSESETTITIRISKK